MRFIKTLKSRNGRLLDFTGIQAKAGSIAKNFNLSLLYLYGSYAGGIPSKLSDIDAGFLACEKFAFEKYALLLGELQDVFEEEAVDLVDLSRAPLTLIHRIFKYGRCLYAVSLSEKIEFEMKMESLYFDAAPLRLEYENSLIRRIQNGAFGHR
jgi:uncharacterized protein